MRNHGVIPVLLSIALLTACGSGGEMVQDRQAGNASDAAKNAKVLNTSADEFAPVMFADGNTVLWTSNREQGMRTRVLSPEFRYGEAVYGVSRPTRAATLQLDLPSAWSSPEPFQAGRLDRVNTGAVYVDELSRTVYLSSTYRQVGDGGADIARLSMDGTEDAVPLPSLNSPWWDAQPSISPDGSLLVFASDRVDTSPTVKDTGRRAPHLWVARKHGDSWSAPERLPAPINSEAEEMSPHFGVDGYLYFATRRWPEAGYELVRSRWADNRWSEVERLPAPFNSLSDDVFPFLSADRMQLMFSSNREGGSGGYDIWYADMHYCVPLNVRVRLLAADAAAGKSEAGQGITIEVVEKSSGAIVAKGTTDADGQYALLCGADAGAVRGRQLGLKVNTEYIVREAGKTCYQGTGDVSISTPPPESIGDGVRVEMELRRKGFPSFHVESDSIWFFVTGYWYPNTTTEYARLKQRLADPRDIPNANFIDMTGPYEDKAKEVDAWFDHLYVEIEKMLGPMFDDCYDAADTLVINVRGYVDPRGLAWGKYEDAETVRTRSAVIEPGTVMARQEGNVKLSHLRAWYSMKMIDRMMKERSRLYTQLRENGRIQMQCDGNYIGYGEKGSTSAGPTDDPFKRKFTVEMEVRYDKAKHKR